MAFKSKLGPSTIVDIDDDTSEDPGEDAPPESIAELSPSAIVNVRDHPTEILATTVKTEATDDAMLTTASKKERGHALQEQWAPHVGFGLCSGVGSQICQFGRMGAPAAAGPDGRCDLCDADSLKDLYNHFESRITHLLRELTPDVLPKGIKRVSRVLGKHVGKMFQSRVERAVKRRDPGRPKRGARGPYKKTKKTTSE